MFVSVVAGADDRNRLSCAIYNCNRLFVALTEFQGLVQVISSTHSPNENRHQPRVNLHPPNWRPTAGWRKKIKIKFLAK